MTNIISFAELIGKAPTVHEYKIAGRTVMYTSLSLAAKAAARKVKEETQGNLTLTNLYDYARELLSAQRYKDGKETTEEWLDTVSYGDFLHFQQFIGNPTAPGDKPDTALPLTLKDFGGYTIILPPVTLGDFKAFAAYLDPENFDGDGLILEQIGRAFDNATLEDGSPLPEGLFKSLTEDEAGALVNFWMNRQRDEIKKDEPEPETGSKKKTATGPKRSRSSARPSASRSSKATPTTSDT